MRRVLLFAALLVALVAGLAATVLLVQTPPVRSAPQPNEFDASGAKERLAVILGNERPHPADSAASDAVRARLLGQIRSIGLNPIHRDQFVCNEIFKRRAVTCARVRNVIVALGPASGGALLLNSHYDSSTVGPGAADAGAGVATMLEVASNLKNKRLGRPVIFLFNEGEELGLLGARAFLADPLSGMVDSLVNLEARGVTGPVTMFETSLPNGPAVRTFARSVARPFANSLATDFYRQLPNYTDVNTFEERGWLTLNFAMIGNETRYHSAGDNLAALDLGSLQHMGDQALAVSRELAASPPGGGGMLLFADLAGRQMVMIPQWLGFALLALMVGGFGWVAFRRKALWRGPAVVLAGLAVAGALAWLVIWAMGEIRPGSFWRAFPIWTHLTVYACGLLAGALSMLLLGRRLTAGQLRAGFWLGFLLLGAGVALVAPGGLIYFLFPPLIVLGGIAAGGRFGWAERAGAIAAGLLLWLTAGQVLAFLGELLNNGPFFLFAPLALLIAMPWLVEARSVVHGAGRAAAPGVSSLLVLIAAVVALSVPAYSADRQQRLTIQHATDATSGRSWWLVMNDTAPLPERFGSIADWKRDELPHIERKGWLAPAPALPGLRPPQIEILGETRSANSRTVAFRVNPNGAQSVTLIAGEDSQILSAGSGAFVRPYRADTEGKYYLTCFGRSCAGAAMQFTTTVRDPLDFTLVGSSPGLPQAGEPLLADRLAHARPQYTPDSTLTISKVKL
jgi:hypothetical protein